MSDKNTEAQVPAEQETEGGPRRVQRPKGLLGWIMVIFVAPIMLAVEGALALRRKVYRDGFTGGLREILGILLGLGSGIGLGYLQGWQWGHPWYSWVSGGLGLAAATYIYLWPLAYLLVFKALSKLATELWDAVDDRSWFTGVLKTATRIAVIGGAAWLGWTSMISAHANLVDNVGAFAWVLGFIWGAIVGLFTLGAGWAVTSWLPGICLATGAALSYAFLDVTQNFVSSFGLTNPVYGYIAAVVQVGIWCAYIFPLIHVIGSHGLRFCRDLARKAYTKAYSESIGQYEGAFLQVSNFYIAYHLAVLSLVGAALGGFALTGWAAIAVPAVVAVLSYVYLGELLKDAGNKALGIFAGAHAAWFAGLAVFGVWGVVPALIVAALAAVVTFYLAYPLAYLFVRLFAQFVLNNRFAGKLVDVHTYVAGRFEIFWREIARARKIAYNDETPFAKLFLHVVNLLALVAVFYYARVLVASVAAAPWLGWTITGLALAVSYFLVGKALLRWQVGLLGTLTGIVAALVVGVFAYAAQSYGYIVAIPVGLLGGVITFVWVFPILYVVVRFVANLVDGVVPVVTKFAEPILSGIYNFLWNRVADVWAMFMDAYRAARDWFKPIWQWVRESWSEAWAYVRDSWKSATRR